MGIDVYAKEVYECPEKEAADKAFRAACAARDKLPPGKKRDAAQRKVMEAYNATASYGYLREAYHGGPYVTRFLVGEAWDKDKRISTKKMRAKLPDAVLLAIYRHHVVYGEGNPGEVVIDDKKPGDTLHTLMGNIIANMKAASEPTEADAILAKITPEQREGAAKMIADRKVPDCALQFVEFVEQCEAWEVKHGKPPMIHVSA